MLPRNLHSRVVVAPNLQHAILTRFNCTKEETSIVAEIAAEAAHIVWEKPAFALIAAFRFMLCKGNDMPCAMQAKTPFASEGWESQAYQLAAQDVSNFDSQVSGSLKEDHEALENDPDLTSDFRLALQYRVDQREMITWQVAWLRGGAARLAAHARADL